MAKLSQLLTIENLLESYDSLKVKDAFVTECFRSCVETTVDHVIAKLNRLLVSKTKLSCRNVLTANFETMTELLKALMLKIKNVDPDFADRFFEILKSRCDRQSVTDYELWKADLPELTIDLLSEYQAEITADMLIMGALKYDRPPSEGEMQKVDLEKLQKKLIHKNQTAQIYPLGGRTFLHRQPSAEKVYVFEFLEAVACTAYRVVYVSGSDESDT